MEEKTEMLELMKRIEKANRRQTVLCILLCVCALVTAICCIVTFGTVNQLLAQVGEIPIIGIAVILVFIGLPQNIRRGGEHEDQ